MPDPKMPDGGKSALTNEGKAPGPVDQSKAGGVSQKGGEKKKPKSPSDTPGKRK